MSPMFVEDGELTEVEPRSGQSVRRLADPVGPATRIYTLHSELATLPSAYPTLERASFRLCLSPGLLEKLLALGRTRSPSLTSSRSSGGRRAARGRLPLVGVKAPEAAISNPEAFLALLDTEVYWDVA